MFIIWPLPPRASPVFLSRDEPGIQEDRKRVEWCLPLSQSLGRPKRPTHSSLEAWKTGRHVLRSFLLHYHLLFRLACRLLPPNKREVALPRLLDH